MAPAAQWSRTTRRKEQSHEDRERNRSAAQGRRDQAAPRAAYDFRLGMPRCSDRLSLKYAGGRGLSFLANSTPRSTYDSGRVLQPVPTRSVSDPA